MKTNGPPSADERSRRGIGRAVEVALTSYAAAVFVALWLYVAAAAFTDGGLLDDTWAWQADLEPLWMGLIVLGLVAWTALALSGLLRTIRRLLARRPA